MITTPQEYYSALYKIQDENYPLKAELLPSTEKIYEVNLNTRTVEVPEFLSVETDHQSEVIYFKINRFYDFMDLSQLACVIEYNNALGESHYSVPAFCDIYTLEREEQMIIPWVISGAATKAAGSIEFVIRFFKISDNDQKTFIYNLTTLPTKGKILHGMDAASFNPEEDDPQVGSTVFQQLISEVQGLKNLITANLLYWIDV